jgi:hypothetical protein
MAGQIPNYLILDSHDRYYAGTLDHEPFWTVHAEAAALFTRAAAAKRLEGLKGPTAPFRAAIARSEHIGRKP